MTHTILHADLLAYLRGNQWLAQNGYIEKAHAILCDPPYALPGGFMSKDWDAFHSPQAFEAWVAEWAGLLIDFVHPGALGLFFGGTRTYHRLAAGLEDAGWEISDCISWVHGQGFPKSASIGKLLDKEAGAAREVVGRVHEKYGTRNGTTFGGSDPLADHWNDRTAPATPLAARWEGYGTAMKPAWEPCVVARAPRGKRTYAALAREFGTGALAIDAARIGTESTPRKDPRNGNLVNAHMEMRPWMQRRIDQGLPLKGDFDGQQGRWPANFALVCACESDDHADDCPVYQLGQQSGERPGASSNSHKSRTESTRHDVAFHDYGTTPLADGYGDTGTAARFFYQAKAAAWERHWPIKSGHPTVKPIRLAEYLARLILPPELDGPRRLLVPFAGSGSEMIGALLAGWDVVTGIEREAEYVDLARARVGWWAQFATYDEARAAYEKAKREPIILPAPVGIADDKPAQLALFEEAAS